jgi:hypothetical protein
MSASGPLSPVRNAARSPSFHEDSGSSPYLPPNQIEYYALAGSPPDPPGWLDEIDALLARAEQMGRVGPVPQVPVSIANFVSCYASTNTMCRSET